MGFIIGIDSGMSGGIGILTDTGKYVDAMRMPVIERKNEKMEIDGDAVADVIRDYDPGSTILVLERQRPFPSFGGGPPCPTCHRSPTTQSPQVHFGIGQWQGLFKGIQAGLGRSWRLEFAEPQVWKKYFGLKGGRENKEKSRQMAIQLYPSAPLTFKKDEGVAESLLMARWFVHKKVAVMQEQGLF